MDIKDIDKLADLARIAIPEEEKESLLKEMSAILGYIDQVSKLAVKNTSRALSPHKNIMREDENSNEGGIYTEALLAAAPEREGQYVKVRQIL